MASIFLAVGHGTSSDGSWDCGCTNGIYTEAKLMYNLVGEMVSILRAHGIDVYTDYDSDNDMNINACVSKANDIGVDIYVSCHCDYTGNTIGGLFPVILTDAGYSIYNCIASQAQAISPLKPRMDGGSYYAVWRDDMEVRVTKMPACILEHGSIGTDLDLLVNNYKEIAQADAFGILDYFGIAHGSVPEPSKPDNKYGFTSVYNSTNYLEYGDANNDVLQFQRDANFCGYADEAGNALTLDGQFGSNSQYVTQCIERFHGLTVDSGEFGRNCDIALMCEVAEIQEALNAHGANIKVDGASGDETLNALIAFQKANGLEQDGRCGDLTRKSLGI